MGMVCCIGYNIYCGHIFNVTFPSHSHSLAHNVYHHWWKWHVKSVTLESSTTLYVPILRLLVVDKVSTQIDWKCKSKEYQLKAWVQDLMVKTSKFDIQGFLEGIYACDFWMVIVANWLKVGGNIGVLRNSTISSTISTNCFFRKQSTSKEDIIVFFLKPLMLCIVDWYIVCTYNIIPNVYGANSSY